jgi:hypothetical protein
MEITYRLALLICEAGLERMGREFASGHLGGPRSFFQEFVDQSLVWFVTFCGQAPELGEEPGRDADRD